MCHFCARGVSQIPARAMCSPLLISESVCLPINILQLCLTFECCRCCLLACVCHYALHILSYSKWSSSILIISILFTHWATVECIVLCFGTWSISLDTAAFGFTECNNVCDKLNSTPRLAVARHKALYSHDCASEDMIINFSVEKAQCGYVHDSWLHHYCIQPNSTAYTIKASINTSQTSNKDVFVYYVSSKECNEQWPCALLTKIPPFNLQSWCLYQPFSSFLIFYVFTVWTHVGHCLVALCRYTVAPAETVSGR